MQARSSFPKIKPFFDSQVPKFLTVPVSTATCLKSNPCLTFSLSSIALFVPYSGDTPDPDLEGQQPVPPNLPERRLQALLSQLLKH